MIKIIFGTLPAWVCLLWAIPYLRHYRQSDLARQQFTWFLGAACILYVSHAFYFNLGLNRWGEGIWMLASLTAYPFYYLYLRQLTIDKALSLRWLWVLSPGLTACILAWTGQTEIAQVFHKVSFALSVILVAVLGYRRLHYYDLKLQQAFADTDNYSVYQTRVVLICFVAASLCSSVINLLGKQYFYDSPWIVAIPSVIFAVLLYILCRISYRMTYVAMQLSEQLSYDAPTPTVVDASTTTEHLSPAVLHKIEQALDTLMNQQQLYLQPDIKLSDLAREIGTCRTYLSIYLNQTLGTDFSSYINQKRVEHAKQQLPQQAVHRSIDSFYRELGFASPRAFFFNFKKHTGMTPEEWIRQSKLTN